MFLAHPGVEEGTSYGTRAFKVQGRFMARLRPDCQHTRGRIVPVTSSDETYWSNSTHVPYAHV